MDPADLVTPFYGLIAEEWQRMRTVTGTDDLLICLDTKKPSARALPREFVLNDPQGRSVIPTDILERIGAPPDVREGYYRSFWVVFNHGPNDTVACTRISVKLNDPGLHPNWVVS